MKCIHPSLLLLGILALLLTCTLPAAAAAGMADWENGTVRADGYGAVPAAQSGTGQAQLLARRAAIVDAWRNLAEAVQGVQVDAETTVHDMSINSDSIRTRVSATVRGARIVSSEMQADGVCHVVMEIPLYGVQGSVASAVLSSASQPEPFLESSPSTPASGTTAGTASGTVPAGTTTGSSAAEVPADVQLPAVGTYTGLIVDCRGMQLHPAMSPVIRDAGGAPIYGYRNLDSAKVIANGMAAYASSEDMAARAGRHPLLVRAVRLDNHNANPVLSVEDANRVLVENRASGFLDHCAVVFLR